MVRKPETPSRRQAQFIAFLWSQNKTTTIVMSSGHIDPTTRVCWRNGWLRFTGNNTTLPSGALAGEYEVSEEGLNGLERYLFEQRCKRSFPT